MTDALQTMFLSLFTDFMIVMITEINADCNLDVLFGDKCSPVVQKLFLELMGTVSIPKLGQLSVLAGNIAQPKPLQYQPTFPFFRYNVIYVSIMTII